MTVENFVPLKVEERFQFEELNSPSEPQHRAKMELCEFAAEMGCADMISPSAPPHEFAVFCENWERTSGQALRFDEEGKLGIIL